MRRIAIGIIAVLVLFAHMASGVRTVYSEGVPAELVAVQQAQEVARRQKLATEAQSLAEAAKAAEATKVVAAVVAPTPRQSAPVAQGDRITIPSIGLAASMVDVGVTVTNNIDVPAGKQVGRWIGAATPGSIGAVFLDGHVDGVFAKLGRVTTGQIFTVTYGNQTFAYRIVAKEVVPLAGIDMNRALSVYGGASEGLNMMTCAGSYVPSMGTYDQRLVVYSVRI